MRRLTDVDLLRELEGTVAANLNRHLEMVQEWRRFPFLDPDLPGALESRPRFRW